MLDACRHTAAALARRIPTSDLNEELQSAVAEHNPPLHRGKPVKLYFMTQADRSPPLFVVSANHGRSLGEAWEKYLVRRIRARWNLRGVPCRIVVRARDKPGQARQRG
jgi:GTP-binding protein